MKNFYYFSKKKLQFVEIRNFYRKFLFLTLFFSLIISFFVFGTYFVVKEIVNPDAEVKSLQTENRILTERLDKLLAQYKEIDKEINRISKYNNDLRLAVNLEPIEDFEREIGIGGSIFKEINPSNSAEVNALVNELHYNVERITAKIKFEKNNYNEISETLKSNKLLYESIPAIKPVIGPYGDRFGLRMHPILKVRRMHNGQDFVVNTGTKVFAPGNGVVKFVGRKAGLGITIILDHGFGYTSIYGHLSKTLVKRNQKITRGDEIALSGNSGKMSTGPHLHYEVRHNGIALNPSNFIYDDIDLFEFIETEN